MTLSSLLEGATYGRYEKFVHWLVSVVLFLILASLLSATLALLLTFAFGVIKECYDVLIRKTAFDSLDLLVNLAGILVAYGLWTHYLTCVQP